MSKELASLDPDILFKRLEEAEKDFQNLRHLKYGSDLIVFLPFLGIESHRAFCGGGQSHIGGTNS